jgi:hypothetical protein
MGEAILHPPEQCLERGKETANDCAGAAEMIESGPTANYDYSLPNNCFNNSLLGDRNRHGHRRIRKLPVRVTVAT